MPRHAAGVTLLLAALVAIPTFAAQRSGPAQQGPATGTVSGRVTGPNGVPLRGAEVRLRDPNGRENRLATTDENGAFEVTNLPPGTWSVSAAKSGYITQHYQQRNPFSAPETVTLAARQRVDVRFILRRGGAIAGRLVDEYGDPVAGARVQVLRARYERGRRRLAQVGVSDQTDDTGAFRLYALPAGDYYLGATLRAAGADGVVEIPVGVPTYYPGTTSIGDAQRLRLAAGEELAGVSFALEPVRPTTVSGVVLSASGTPATDASVMLLAANDLSVIGAPLGNFGRAGAGGTFVIANVAPGTYRLQVRSGAVFDPMAGQGEEALMPLTVGPEGLSGITVTTARTPPITGTVVTESGAALPPNLSVGVGLRQPGGGADFIFTVRSSARAALPLRVPGLVGLVTFTIDPPRGWMVKQVELDGADVTNRLFELRSATPTAKVTLTDRITRITGAVRRDGRPSPGAQVVFFPDDADTWPYPSRYVTAVKADDRGTFAIDGVPPHQDYLAVALDALETGDTEDPEFLASLREKGTRLSVDYGETATLTLDLVAR